jgi:hypothetical protein
MHLKGKFSKIFMFIIILILLLSTISSIPGFGQVTQVETNDAQQTNEQVQTDNNTQADEPTPERIQAVITNNVTDHVVDINDNELFDYLILEVTIKVGTPGYYELGSKLILGDGRPVMYVYKDMETERQVIVIQLKFDGKPIYSSKISGQFYCELWITNETGETVSRKEHKTNEYYYKEFEHAPPPIELLGRFGDNGFDRDSNGLFDSLNIHFMIKINEPGQYAFLAGLFKEIQKEEESEPFYHLITVSRLILDLAPGNETIKMHFLGSRIHLAKHDGLYHVGLWIAHPDDRDRKLDENTENVNDEYLMDLYNDRFRWPMVGVDDFSERMVFETEKYLFTQFEEPPKIVEFTKRVKESTIDPDNDGLIDFLVLGVGVRVKEPGEYLYWGKILTGDR